MALIDLYVLDKQYGKVHRIGDDRHDSMWVDYNGVVHFMNLQCGDGCSGNGNNSHSGFAFIPSDCGSLEQPVRCLCGYDSDCNYPIDSCYDCPLRERGTKNDV